MNKEILEKINIEINSITQSSDFIKLDDLTNEEDLFSILKIHRKELVHSDFLAKLLNPNSFDDLRDKFLIRFLSFIQKEKPILNRLFKDGRLISSPIIYREYYNIDLVLIFINEKIILSLENKIDDDEMPGQIGRYQNFLFKELPDLERVYLFLTIDKRPSFSCDPKREPVLSISYSDIDKLLEDVVPEIQNRNTKYIVEQFMKHLKVEFTSEIKELCVSFYKKYPIFYKTLIKNSLPYLENFSDLIYKIGEEFGFDPLKKETWDYPNSNSLKTQICFTKAEYELGMGVLFFISQNKDQLYEMYVIPTIAENKISELKRVLPNIEINPVPQYEKDWTWFSIKTEAIPISDDPLIDKNLEQNIRKGFKEALLIIQDINNQVKEKKRSFIIP